MTIEKPQRIHIESIPFKPMVISGAWAGFVPGLLIGALLGALISWGAGATLEWMRTLSFTTGIESQLLPFGDRIGTLETLQDQWGIVIPASAVAVGLVSALIGALTAAVAAASYGSLFGGIEVVIEPAERRKRAVRARRPRRRTDSAA
jgi:hypothetical protein